jgi:hypothetical protein
MSVHAGSIWIDQNLANIPQDVWVATNATGLISESRNLGVLMNFLVLQQVPLVGVTIAYIPAGTFQ